MIILCINACLIPVLRLWSRNGNSRLRMSIKRVSKFETLKAAHFISLWKGVSADADPHYQKLYGRVTDVCSNRRGQPSPSAMKEPRPGRNPSLIRFASPSGKYAFGSDMAIALFSNFYNTCGFLKWYLENENLVPLWLICGTYVAHMWHIMNQGTLTTWGWGGVGVRN